MEEVFDIEYFSKINTVRGGIFPLSFTMKNAVSTVIQEQNPSTKIHRGCSIKQPFCKFESKLRKVQQTYVLAFEAISADLITILDLQPKQGN